MAYTDPTTVRVALSPGGDDADLGSAAFLSDDDLTAKITDATDEVNAKLAERYAIPFTGEVPDLVKTITTAIAAYLATLTAYQGVPIENTNPVVLAYNRAESMLSQLQVGKMVLAGDTAPDPSPTSTIAVANMLTGAVMDPRDYPVPPRYPQGSGYGFSPLR